MDRVAPFVDLLFPDSNRRIAENVQLVASVRKVEKPPSGAAPKMGRSSLRIQFEFADVFNQHCAAATHRCFSYALPVVRNGHCAVYGGDLYALFIVAVARHLHRRVVLGSGAACRGYRHGAATD